ncbi:MAG: exosortase/archaeosortase family protein [Akkermansiaceae bacterium]
MKATNLKNLLFVTLSVAALLVWMFFIQGYATGYWNERSSLHDDILVGYNAQGGDWGFGRVILPAVILLAWFTRARYRDLEIKPDYVWGLLFLVLGFFVYFAGYKANQKYIGFASGNFLVMGLVFWFLGKQWFIRGFWLFVLFGLAWPWLLLIEPISSPLQVVMVKLTTTFLHLVGDDALRSGTAIESTKIDPVTGETIKLNIEAACSGIRSLFALLMMAVIYGYLSLRKEWKRFTLVALVPLICIIANFARMLMLYYGAQTLGSQVAIGDGEHDPSSYHIAAGLVVFVVAMIVMIILVEVMNHGFRIFKKRKTVVKALAPSNDQV